MTAGLLDAVVEAARRAADERQRLRPDPLGDTRTSGQASIIGFRDSLRLPGLRIIAECKRRSPSRGILRGTYDPVAIARSYEANGAAAISVLTEPTFFDGALAHLQAVRRAVHLPLLRKDFLVTPYQVHEAAAAGANAVLLIVAALDDGQLRALMAEATRLGLDALVEVHDRAELDRALAAGATIVGVNSRNLRTLAVSVGVLDALAPSIPDEVTAVAESGLKTAGELERLKRLRYDAFLIGERFVTAAEPGQALAALVGRGQETTE
jgi:indole-3-glycerol phosphate synthase